MKFLELFRDWKDVDEHDVETVIYSSGDPTDVLYFILSGEIELTLHGETLGIERAGGIIGEMAMLSSATQSATATTLSKVQLARFDRTQLNEFVSRNNGFSIHVMSVLADRLRAIDKYITTRIVDEGDWV